MITREELIRSKEYWLARLQAMLYQQVEEYLKENKMTKSDFAQKLGVSKGYISQVLNGDFDHKLSKFIELSLMIDKVPLLKLEDIEKILLLDKEEKLNEKGSSATGITKSYNSDVKRAKEEPGWVVNDSDETKPD
ncbi:MAG: helix-turn-helix domain-containing protein [Bacteroidetes bacterium]|nr:MAG: helix-turn-helix domain-containing protein [Bacteroidota bacterium]